MDQIKSSSSASIASGELPIVDTRGMDAPKHILFVLKRASEMDGHSFVVKLDNNPFQLYDLLQQRGFFFAAKKLPDGSFEGLVRPRNGLSY